MEFELPTTAEALSRIFQGAIVGDGSAQVRSLAPLSQAGSGTLSYCVNKKYGSLLNQLKGAILLTSEDLVRPELPLTYIVVANPQEAFARVARQFSLRAHWEGISPQAIIDPSAFLAEGVKVGPFAIVCEGASIGKGSTLYPFVYVGADVEIGEQCEIHPQVTILDRVTVGNRVKIFSGSVLGSDGFGLVTTEQGMSEMPQIGTVVIEDDVRVGAHCSIDRGTIGETRIGANSKLDDQVHVGHNCRIGRNCVLCGQVGLSGSVVLEDNVVLGGQVGIADHVVIGKKARLAGQSGTSSHLPGEQDYFGSPAIPIKESFKILRQIRKLPELAARLKRLEQALDRKTMGGPRT
jgi:UDP-3-O-[3-hydroxymyristoyl] glucosamine N-acyltransferase